MDNEPINVDNSEENLTDGQDNSSPDKLLPDDSPDPENASGSPLEKTDQSERDLNETGQPEPESENEQSEPGCKTDQSEPGSNTEEAEPESQNDQSQPCFSPDDLKPDLVATEVISGSPRVQFGAGTKEMDGSSKGVKRVKRSFKDIVLTEVMKADPQELAVSPGPVMSSPPKGILKVRSEPGLSGSDKSQSYINKGFESDEDGAPSGSGKVATTSRSAWPFLKRSGEPGSGGAGGQGQGHGFADVVDLLIQRTSLDSGGRDVHPFGRDCSIEGIMQASRPKSHSRNSAFSKLMIWITLLSFLLGTAFGVIFLSETYNARRRADILLKASHNGTYS